MIPVIDFLEQRFGQKTVSLGPNKPPVIMFQWPHLNIMTIMNALETQGYPRLEVDRYKYRPQSKEDFFKSNPGRDLCDAYVKWGTENLPRDFLACYDTFFFTTQEMAMLCKLSS